MINGKSRFLFFSMTSICFIDPLSFLNVPGRDVGIFVALNPRFKSEAGKVLGLHALNKVLGVVTGMTNLIELVPVNINFDVVDAKSGDLAELDAAVIVVDEPGPGLLEVQWCLRKLLERVNEHFDLGHLELAGPGNWNVTLVLLAVRRNRGEIILQHGSQ